MKISKKLLAGLIVFSLIGAAFATVPLWAATTSDVSATVTPKLITVSVSDGNVAYGILGLNVTKNTALYNVTTNPSGMSPADTQTATNGSNVGVALNIMSSDATGGTTWQLATGAGSDAFVHQFKGGDAIVWTQLPVDHTYATLDAKPAAVSIPFDLQITTPTVTSDYIPKTIAVTVQVTE